MSSNDLFVYTACYDNEDVARGDLEAFQEMAAAGPVGKYDTAILSKTADGKVKVEKHGTPAKSGGWKGAVAGGIVGLLFPPSILAGTLTGAASGAVAGKLWGGMSRDVLKELGEVLDYGEIGSILLGPRHTGIHQCCLDHRCPLSNRYRDILVQMEKHDRSNR